MKAKRIIAMSLSVLATTNVIGISAFARMIPGFEYDADTETVTYVEKDSSELPMFENSFRYLPETSFNQLIRQYPESTKLSPDIPLSAGEEYIYVTFDANSNYRIRLRNAESGTYLTNWSSAMTNSREFFYHNFPVDNVYNIYLAATTGDNVRMSGTIYTQ